MGRECSRLAVLYKRQIVFRVEGVSSENLVRYAKVCAVTKSERWCVFDMNIEFESTFLRIDKRYRRERFFR